MNRFKKTVGKMGNSKVIRMPEAELDEEYYVMSEAEFKLIVGSDKFTTL